MMYAYDKIYLSSAQRSLGTMLDVAINEWKQEIESFYDKFLKSIESIRFSRGDIQTIAGKSGIELAYDVLGIEDRTTPDLPINRSEEYWAGWTLAYYQWYTGVSFQVLNDEVPITSIVDMYVTFHEMDIMQSVDEINRLRQANRCMTYLKYFRKQRGITQRQLADATAIPVKTIQQYEQGLKSINKAQSEYVIRLARELYCRPEQLLEP